MKKRILEHLGSFMMSILLIILGILAFVAPQIFTGALVWIVGTILIAVGVFYMISHFSCVILFLEQSGCSLKAS